MKWSIKQGKTIVYDLDAMPSNVPFLDLSEILTFTRVLKILISFPFALTILLAWAVQTEELRA